MAAQNLVPGLGFVNETTTKQNLLPGGGFLSETTAAGTHTVNATCDALTLAEYAATVSKSLNISAGVDALTLAEYPATIGSVLNVQATADALTLAEYPASIGLSLNIQAGAAALTLTEYPAPLGSTHNVNATTDALTLAEYPATLSFVLNVSCNTATLILAEYSATVSSGETSRPLGLSPWLDLDTETTDTRRDRIRRDRERMGILAPEAIPAPEKPQERAKRPSKPIAEGNAFAPPVARSESATRQVLSLADARAQKEADAARILAVLEFEAEQRRLKAIRYRTALLLLAAEA